MANQSVTIPSPLNPGDTLTITVGAIPPTITNVTVTGPAALVEGVTAQYTAHVSGTGNFNPGVTWSASDGTITASGLFTAPAKVETVTISAASVQDPTKIGNCPVAISNPSNTVQISPSGGDDTSELQSAINQTASAGKILEMLTGTWHINPINLPGGTNLLVDPGTLVTDQSAYSANACMWNINAANVKLTATGAFFQMPLSHAQSIKDGSEYRHCVVVGQGSTASNVTLSGVTVDSSGGDCLYIRNCSAVSVQNFGGSGAYRNGLSCTGKVNGLTITNATLKQNGRGDLDFEPNTNTDFLENISVNNLATSSPNVGGMSFGLQNLDSSTPPVSITVNGFTSNGAGSTKGPAYGCFFGNSETKASVGGAITVNNATVSNCVSGGVYGKYTGGTSARITFNNLVVTNPNLGGIDRLGMCAPVGVELYGGQPGPAGNTIFNVKQIAASPQSMAYFQIASGAVNTQFNAPSGSCTGAPAGSPTKYP